MRINLIIRDKEYARAMAEVISETGKDVFVELGPPPNDLADNDNIIITDADARELSSTDYSNIIFLTKNRNDRLLDDNEGKPIKIFKYSSINSILSDIEHIHYLLSGNKDISNGLLSRVFAVCSDGYSRTNTLAMALARQILYRRGGDMIIISMEYVNNYPCQYESDRSRFSRWMYYMDIKRNYSIDEFITTDSYGISYLRLPSGLNPVAYMNLDEATNLIEELCRKKFETVILDIGNNYSELNVRLINKSDHILYFVGDTAKLDINEVLVEQGIETKLQTIAINDKLKEIELVIDEYVAKLYGDKEGELSNEQESNSKKIQ